ncbi:MAG: dinitrogenase iron-molybdenum cofactor biosynthesis protein [Fretibacterium sp.]|nr:dinitrogenase iron-molybdenum cofactor biosynthesis protein [Fretibacterium sp.]
MKVAIPVDENKSGTAVCASFGRAPYFLIHNTENGETEFLANAAADAQGGAGIKAAQFVVDSGAGALLTIRCGQNAADVLNAAGVKIYKTSAGGADENLANFREGKLVLLTEFHAGFHRHQ